MAPPRRPRAAVVAVGNELLYGETVDTNSAWLGRRLAGVGIAVVRRYTVGDVDADIDDAVRQARAVAELVVVTGGLGPTPDDRTKDVVARQLGLGLVVDPSARVDVARHFAAAGEDEIPARSRGQAEIPEGATVLHNPTGTAPGLLVQAGDSEIVLLPGVPRELRAIVDGALAPHLERWGGGEPTHHRVIHTTGLAETKLAERLEARLRAVEAEVKDGIDLAYLPDLRGVDLRFTVRGGLAEAAHRRFDRLLAALDDVLGPWRFESASGDVAEAVTERLRASGWTLAVAESCTGGLVGKRITDVPGVSDVFLGGVVAYADAVKTAQLGVPPDVIERHGAVSEAVARALSEGAARRFGADAAIGVTGVAGPGGGSKEKPVGTVWIATTVGGVAQARAHRFPGDREAVRERAAQAALAALHRRLPDLPEQP